ncbi:hypothetical protein BGZ76_006036 [Entomortierella beljakovae]|nr:hypothetical protein BGZ76_006036 [Entomortierella beljakovae]
MAPIQRMTGSPLSIITGALFTAFSAPHSSPPSNGLNATVWDTEYSGSASYFDLSLYNSTSSSSPSAKSSLVYYNTKTGSHIGCDKKPFSATDNVVLMNPLQFGDINSDNSTCGEWIQVQNRENTMQSTLARVVGVCDDCEYGSIDLTSGALNELVPDVSFDDITFDENSENTLQDYLASDSSESMSISPKDLLSVTWTLTDPPSNDVPASTDKPKTTTSTTTTTTSSSDPSPTPTSPSSPQYSGRATWYSDTTGWCEHTYSQSDLIVAVNQAQMGSGKDLCGKKILLSMKGSDVKVAVTIVDMCPSQYCKSGDLDLSQAAFKKFASLGVGILNLNWSFM